MTRLLILISTVVLPILTEYSLNFEEASSSVSYDYKDPIDFTNGVIRLKLNIDLDYYNNYFNAGPTSAELVKVESSAGDDAIYDVLQLDLMRAGVEDYPILMIIVSTPKSSDTMDASSFCFMMSSYDFHDKEITITKTGGDFELAIEGASAETFYCQGTHIGAPGTGAMNISHIKISSLVGCASQLQFPQVNLLPADDCGFPLDFLSDGVTYFEGACSDNNPTEEKVCPTPVPAIEAPEPTPEPIPEPTTEQKVATTLPKVTTPETTTPPADEQTASETSSIVTTSIVPTTPLVDLPGPSTEASGVDTTDENEVEATTDPNSNNPDEEDGGYVIADEEAVSSGNNSSLYIIICVVGAGIIVVVVLLYIGYKFHFRDKGSYKLEEVKQEPGDEYNGTEYTELNNANGNGKDQEWYL